MDHEVHEIGALKNEREFVQNTRYVILLYRMYVYGITYIYIYTVYIYGTRYIYIMCIWSSHIAEYGSTA